ncbi:SDR family oxidoreductase [Pseudorhizobium pelagicum]|uniref:SDR family oxidoreductase n=1 Tax=Pseudorhizobium pelagicum TaxID=1509405 RepID=UPI001FD96186|nr:SDR family oxidoreductase [Pseudorhizobium pelagicum]
MTSSVIPAAGSVVRSAVSKLTQGIAVVVRSPRECLSIKDFSSWLTFSMAQNCTCFEDQTSPPAGLGKKSIEFGRRSLNSSLILSMQSERRTTLSTNVLITGANKSIGFETARQLGERGYRVWLGARDAGRGETAAAALRELGHDVRFIEIAVEHDASVQAAAERVSREDGKLDALVNNAGIPGAFIDPVDQTVDDIRRVYEINVFGPIRVIQAFLPLLKRAGSANVVNVSSELGSLGSLTDPQNEFYGVNSLGYNSSKTALNAVTVSFSKALASSGIRVNSADPGYTKTDFNGNTGYRTVEQAAKVIVQLVNATEGETGSFMNDQRRLPW